MRKFTNKNQTEHLKRYGFPEPADVFVKNGGTWVAQPGNYSIGDLIGYLICPDINPHGLAWKVTYSAYTRDKQKIGHCSQFIADELIDALYFACVRLKKEGEILCRR